MQMSESSFLHLQAFEEQQFTRELELRRLARERYGAEGAPLGPTVLGRVIHAVGLDARQRSTRRLRAARVVAERRVDLRSPSPGGVAGGAGPARTAGPAHAAR